MQKGSVGLKYKWEGGRAKVILVTFNMGQSDFSLPFCTFVDGLASSVTALKLVVVVVFFNLREASLHRSHLTR